MEHMCAISYEILPEWWSVDYMQRHNAKICDNGVPHLMEVTCSDYEGIFHRNKHFQNATKIRICLKGNCMCARGIL